MKDKTIYLEASREKKRLKIGICRPADVIWHYEDFSAPVDQIETCCNEMTEFLNRATEKGGGGSQIFEKLRIRGRRLCDLLLKQKIKESLIKTDADYLILKVDDRLVHIPWELLCAGQEFLCQRFSMGRQVKTRQEIPATDVRTLTEPLKMWILANPRADLPVADSEGKKIFKDMALMNPEETVIIDPRRDREVTVEQAKENIKTYDFIHFAGHGDYNSQNPVQGGWRLTDGDFSASDIDGIAGGAPMPAFVFSNACQSAHTEEWEGEQGTRDDSFGLVNAFLRAGVKHYVGTFWKIVDEPGSLFAYEFYELLRSGRAIGEAVRQARCNLTDKHGADICWASYVLYGDPRVSYFGCQDEEPDEPPDTTRTKIEPAIVKETQTRGELFPVGLNPMEAKGMQILLLFCLMFYAVKIFSDYSEIKKAEITIEQEKTDFEQRTKIEELLMERAEETRKRTMALFDDLIALTGPSLRSETKPLTMAVVLDPEIVKRGKEKMILHAFKDQIIESEIPVKVAARGSFDIILEERIWKAKATPPEDRKPLRFLMPRFLLILAVCDSGTNSDVLMQMVDVETDHLLRTHFGTLDNTRAVMAQKKGLAGRNFLEKLKAVVTEYSSEN